MFGFLKSKWQRGFDAAVDGQTIANTLVRLNIEDGSCDAHSVRNGFAAGTAHLRLEAERRVRETNADRYQTA